MPSMFIAYHYVNNIFDINDAIRHHPFMADAPDPRIITPIPRSLLEAIDDYRFTARLPSRAEAIRRLIELGLEATKPQQESAPP